MAAGSEGVRGRGHPSPGVAKQHLLRTAVRNVRQLTPLLVRAHVRQMPSLTRRHWGARLCLEKPSAAASDDLAATSRCSESLPQRGRPRISRDSHASSGLASPSPASQRGVSKQSLVPTSPVACGSRLSNHGSHSARTHGQPNVQGPYPEWLVLIAVRPGPSRESRPSAPSSSSQGTLTKSSISVALASSVARSRLASLSRLKSETV